MVDMMKEDIDCMHSKEEEMADRRQKLYFDMKISISEILLALSILGSIWIYSTKIASKLDLHDSEIATIKQTIKDDKIDISKRLDRIEDGIYRLTEKLIDNKGGK